MRILGLRKLYSDAPNLHEEVLVTHQGVIIGRYSPLLFSGKDDSPRAVDPYPGYKPAQPRPPADPSIGKSKKR
jgi:hypothetical protein